jgi:hypothetical protein
MDRRTSQRKREPSRLALELASAFAPFAQWSEVRVERGAEGRRTRVIDGPAGGAAPNVAPAPFDWAAGAL